MRLYRYKAAFTVCVLITLGAVTGANAQVKAGDVIDRNNSSRVAELVSPGNYVLVQQGMAMKIAATGHLDWPPPFKTETERYSPQVGLDSDGVLTNYKAGLPFPFVDVNDPEAALKIMWNYEFRPLYTDDLDARDVEVVSHEAGRGDPVETMLLGHMGFYKSVGRTEVAPTPLDADIFETGIAFRAGIFPVLEPAEMRGAGIVREGSVRPGVQDAVWEYSGVTRRLRRLPAAELSDAFGVPSGGSGGGQRGGGTPRAATYASTLDPDSSFGFSARLQNYSYRLLGERAMLASVDAANSPAVACAEDGGRTICPENWQMRQLYVVEATAKKHSSVGGVVSIPKRILYIDSEGWFITASDLFDCGGQLWKSIAIFHAYRDRPVANARVAIWPFKRMFQTALVDEDITSGFSTTVFTPGRTGDSECWYINSGMADRSFFTPAQLEMGH